VPNVRYWHKADIARHWQPGQLFAPDKDCP